jgi:uracil phosphoribosyltransferase
MIGIATLSLLPENTSVLHVGLFREKVSLQPVEYYSKVWSHSQWRKRSVLLVADVNMSWQLPAEPTVDKVFILDPLVATGGTSIVSTWDIKYLHPSLQRWHSIHGQACIGMIRDWGIPLNNIKLLCILGSQTGLEAVQKAWPGLDIWWALSSEYMQE